MVQYRSIIRSVMVLSALGLCLSIITHIVAMRGVSFEGSVAGAFLTCGGPLIVVIADLAFDRLDGVQGPSSRWDSFFRATPVWSRWLFGVVVCYFVFGFIYSWIAGHTPAVWDAATGEPPSSQVVLTFSRWWILLYSTSLFAMLGARRRHQC